jgi:acyl carrier protein
MVMALDSTYAQLTDIFQNIFDDDSLRVTPDLTGDQISGWDSFAHLRLVFAIEQTFGVSFTIAQIDSLKNIGDLANVIDEKRGSR